jgi:chemotaxis protein methyltransferase CheR
LTNAAAQSDLNRDASVALVPDGPVLRAQDFSQIAAILHTDTGIHLPEAKTSLVYSRLAKRLRALGLSSFREYCALVTTREGADERQQMIAALTTNVTRFFREPHHFEHLKASVLPPLIAAVRRNGRVRIWSAGCSSGPEPYSIALTILSLMPEAANFDVKVLATDIDPHMIAAGRAGLYDDEALAPVPSDMRQRWFVPQADRGTKKWSAGDELREIVAFRELNLIGSWPMKGTFHAIFCRNVVIYFDLETQSKIWARFMPLISPGGVLYIGHSERLTGSAASAFASEGVTTYRLSRGSAK